MPTPVRKESNVPKLKSSKSLTTLNLYTVLAGMPNSNMYISGPPQQGRQGRIGPSLDFGKP
jgi:hypothetical protein